MRSITSAKTLQGRHRRFAMSQARRLALTLHALLVLGLAPAAWAQDPDPVGEAPIRAGIFGVAPRIVITNLGVDTNVFNEANDPKQDFTVQAAPGAEVWMRAGRWLVTANAGVQLTNFNEYDSERSVGGTGSLRYEHRFNRLAPFASYAASNTRQRPGYEIDVRARAIGSTLRGGLGVRVGPKADGVRRGVARVGHGVGAGVHAPTRRNLRAPPPGPATKPACPRRTPGGDRHRTRSHAVLYRRRLPHVLRPSGAEPAQVARRRAT
ncbi:MAG: hypothetical protein Q8L86_17810 [Vicinamibacterales bacterium]|nr:hypothetical protein [Vicinamibacterales bacterium]